MADPASIRYFNPGAMWPGLSATRFGSTNFENLGDGNKIAVFPDFESGGAAQFDLLSRKYSGKTLRDAIHAWSGGNSSPAYATSVARATGMTPDDVLTEDFFRDPGRAVPFARAMAAWEAGRPHPASENDWMAAHRRYLGNPPSTSAPLITGRPMAAEPNPLDVATGKWTPDDIIKQQYGLANQFRSTPQATSGWGALAQTLGGLFGGMAHGGADMAVRGNQDVQSQALKTAMGQPDLRAQAESLMKSGVPALEMKGAAILEQLGLKRAEQQENWNMIARALGMGPPNAVGANSTPTGVPGIVTGRLPSATTGMPDVAPSTVGGIQIPQKPKSQFDSKTLGFLVAAKLILPEAAKLLQDDRAFEESQDKHLGEHFAKRYVGYAESLPKLGNMLATYNVLESLIKNPATIQGMGAGVRKQFDRALEMVGIKTEGLQPTQIMEALSNELTIQMRQMAGGMPGAMSDNDLKFLTAMTANSQNNPEANAFLVQMRKRTLQREREIAGLAIRYAQANGGRLDNGFDILVQKYADQNPLWSETEMRALSGEREKAEAKSPGSAGVVDIKAVADLPLGSRRQDPKTGNMMVKTGPNTWAPEGEAPAASPAVAPAPAVPPAPAPAPARRETPAEKSARSRAAAAQDLATANSPEQAQRLAADTARIQADFNTDARALTPVQMAQKYDGVRGQLTPDQREILNQLIAKMTAR